MRGEVKKLWAATAAVAVVVAGGAVAAATTADAAPVSRAAGTSTAWVTPRAASAPHDRYLSGWLPYWSASASYATVTAHASRFSSAMPFAYSTTLTSRGRLAVTRHANVLRSADVNALRARGVKVVPTVTTGLTAPQVSRLRNASLRARHVATLVSLVAGTRYDGLELDYEHQARTTSVRQARATADGYSLLVRDLCARLHRIHKVCYVTVMPRVDGSYRTWHTILIPAVYDYAALGRAADRVRVMAYDEHNCFTGRGPVSSLPWVRRVVAYTLENIPASKVELGVPSYGYRWSAGRCRSVVGAGNVSGRYDWAAGEVTDGSAWYVNGTGMAARVRIARQNHLAGVAIWAPSMMGPAAWRAVAAA
jgi:spore germination protein YaaH